MKGTRSLLIPSFRLKLPRKCPKSMWNSWEVKIQTVKYFSLWTTKHSYFLMIHWLVSNRGFYSKITIKIIISWTKWHSYASLGLIKKCTNQHCISSSYNTRLFLCNNKCCSTTLWSRAQVKLLEVLGKKSTWHLSLPNRPLVVDFSVKISSYVKYQGSRPHLSGFPDHDIVIVTISNSQDISGYTVASTWQRELFYCLIKFAPVDRKVQRNREAMHEWVLFLQYIYTSAILI